jgi:hypothetical protein
VMSDYSTTRMSMHRLGTESRSTDRRGNADRCGVERDVLRWLVDRHEQVLAEHILVVSAEVRDPLIERGAFRHRHIVEALALLVFPHGNVGIAKARAAEEPVQNV